MSFRCLELEVQDIALLDHVLDLDTGASVTLSGGLAELVELGRFADMYCIDSVLDEERRRCSSCSASERAASC